MNAARALPQHRGRQKKRLVPLKKPERRPVGGETARAVRTEIAGRQGSTAPAIWTAAVSCPQSGYRPRFAASARGRANRTVSPGGSRIRARTV